MSDEIKTPELMEAERIERIAHINAISSATLEVEKVLIAHNLTMDDFGEIVATFNARAQAVFSAMKINHIKDSYGRQNK